MEPNEPLTPEEKEDLKSQIKETPKDKRTPKKLRWPFKKKSGLSQAIKKPEMINVLYLNQKLGIEVMQTKLYGGNFFVIRDKVYRFRANRIWHYGKFSFVVAREFDRELVGMEDYDEIINLGSQRTPLNDPVLIKAIIQAKLAEKKPAAAMSWIWIVLAVVVGIVAVSFFIKGKPAAPVEAAATTPTGTMATPVS